MKDDRASVTGDLDEGWDEVPVPRSAPNPSVAPQSRGLAPEEVLEQGWDSPDSSPVSAAQTGGHAPSSHARTSSKKELRELSRHKRQHDRQRQKANREERKQDRQRVAHRAASSPLPTERPSSKRRRSVKSGTESSPSPSNLEACGPAEVDSVPTPPTASYQSADNTKYWLLAVVLFLVALGIGLVAARY